MTDRASGTKPSFFKKISLRRQQKAPSSTSATSSSSLGSTSTGTSDSAGSTRVEQIERGKRIEAMLQLLPPSQPRLVSKEDVSRSVIRGEGRRSGSFSSPDKPKSGKPKKRSSLFSRSKQAPDSTLTTISLDFPKSSPPESETDWRSAIQQEGASSKGAGVLSSSTSTSGSASVPESSSSSTSGSLDKEEDDRRSETQGHSAEPLAPAFTGTLHKSDTYVPPSTSLSSSSLSSASSSSSTSTKSTLSKSATSSGLGTEGDTSEFDSFMLSQITKGLLLGDGYETLPASRRQAFRQQINHILDTQDWRGRSQEGRAQPVTFQDMQSLHERYVDLRKFWIYKDPLPQDVEGLQKKLQSISEILANDYWDHTGVTAKKEDAAFKLQEDEITPLQRIQENIKKALSGPISS